MLKHSLLQVLRFFVHIRLYEQAHNTSVHKKSRKLRFQLFPLRRERDGARVAAHSLTTLPVGALASKKVDAP